QDQFSPMPVFKQIMIIYAGTNGFLDDLPVGVIKKFEQDFYKYMEKNYPDIQHDIETKLELNPALTAKMDQAIEAFKKEFNRSRSS
ncbi:MAG: F0F1 ATP synthase subunit alpha, partial [Candidatus Omnitrophica bacterium]|nr:F0F1 ATP synthase subunit alpha [Candidatus Omnitrophota bacterium]